MFKIKENNINKWIIIIPIMGIIFTSCIITIFYVDKIKTHYNDEIKSLHKINKENLKNIIRNRIDITKNLIDNFIKLNNHHKIGEVKKEIQELINKTEFQNDGYIFAYDFKGNTIAHVKKNLLGKNRWKLKKDNIYIVQELINRAKKNKNGFFYEYQATINPKTNLSAKKISYITKLNHFDWIIGTGEYINEIQSINKLQIKKVNEELLSSIKKTVLISIIITIFGIIIMSYLSKNIYKIFKRYQDTILRKNFDLEKKVLQRTSEQNSLLELFNKADTMLFKWDYKSNNFSYLSSNIHSILGYEKKDLLEKKIIFSNLLHKADLDKYNAEYQNVRNNKLDFIEHTPYRIIDKNGDIKWLYERKLIVRDKEGNLTSLIGYMSDFTKIKDQENSLFNERKMLALNDMIDNIAHQWRQPLSAISTAASGIKLHEQYEILEKGTLIKLTDGIIENCNNLSNIIETFNYLSKNTQEINLFDVNVLLHKSIKLLNTNIISNNIKIYLDLKNEVKIYLNEQNIIQVFIHIINNSIDELKKQKNDFKKLILINLEVNKKEIIINFKDNAGGIKEKYINKIFEPYFTTKHKSQGTGLDLYISKKMMHDINGDITVENNTFEYKNKNYTGALFKVILPID
ncbi:MAG: PAS domain-containing protein [Arcobacter sp.]|nr:PAS domain-containing protein [Arcobacter sp.]